MRDLGFGEIILLILFVLVPLIKFVIQRVRTRPEDQILLEDQIPLEDQILLEDQIPEEESVTQILRPAQATPAPLPTPLAPRDQVRELQAPMGVIPLARSQFTRRALLGTPRDLRRGIIIMTILGPCRASDPPDKLSPIIN